MSDTNMTGTHTSRLFYGLSRCLTPVKGKKARRVGLQCEMADGRYGVIDRLTFRLKQGEITVRFTCGQFFTVGMDSLDEIQREVLRKIAKKHLAGVLPQKTYAYRDEPGRAYVQTHVGLSGVCIDE